MAAADGAAYLAFISGSAWAVAATALAARAKAAALVTTLRFGEEAISFSLHLRDNGHS